MRANISITDQDANALIRLCDIAYGENCLDDEAIRLLSKFKTALNLKKSDLRGFWQTLREFECLRHQMVATGRYGYLKCKLCDYEGLTPKLSYGRFVMSEETKLKLWVIAESIAPHLGIEPSMNRCGFNLSWQDNDPRFSCVYGHSAFRIKLSNRGYLTFVREAGGEMAIRGNHTPERLAALVRRWLKRLADKQAA